jgi:uncharacterized membrane protein YfcA
MNWLANRPALDILAVSAVPGWQNYLLLMASALAAGVINSVAGGGTLLTFPALLRVVDPVIANATSTVALVPGSLAGAWGYRREMKYCRRWLLLLAPSSAVGGAVGALLVTRLNPKYFALLVPWLILVAAILFLIQPMVGKLVVDSSEKGRPSNRVVAGLVAFQFVVAVYGGYFGAGIGILMLSALGIMGIEDIHRMNAVKTVLAGLINAVSVVVFVWDDKVRWNYGIAMAVAAVAGGYLGARTARRLDRRIVRSIVIAIGFTLAGYYFASRVS